MITIRSNSSSSSSSARVVPSVGTDIVVGMNMCMLSKYDGAAGATAACVKHLWEDDNPIEAVDDDVVDEDETDDTTFISVGDVAATEDATSAVAVCTLEAVLREKNLWT